MCPSVRWSSKTLLFSVPMLHELADTVTKHRVRSSKFYEPTNATGSHSESPTFERPVYTIPTASSTTVLIVSGHDAMLNGNGQGLREPRKPGVLADSDIVGFESSRHDILHGDIGE